MQRHQNVKLTGDKDNISLIRNYAVLSDATMYKVFTSISFETRSSCVGETQHSLVDWVVYREAALEKNLGF